MMKIGYVLVVLLVTACKKEGNDTTDVIDNTPLPSDKTNWWQPSAGVTFDWDLDDIKSSDTFTATVVDLDAFTTTAEQVAALHAQGKKVIAYISAGTIENDRPDAGLLPKEVIGKVYPEWPNEKWLDIRQPDRLKPWLNSRFNMIIKKGFDAIEPDNLDSYSNVTGFNISISDTQKYCDYLILLAHQNGLGIGQKNVPELSAKYSSKFDWVLTEDAFKQGWQNEVKVYAGVNKPVFAVEYTDEMTAAGFQSNVCPQAKAFNYTAILKNRNLDKWADSCK